MIDFTAALKTEPKPKPKKGPDTVLPAKVDPFDLVPVKVGLEPYDAAIKDMAKQVNTLEVKNTDSNILAVEMAGQVKQLNKALEGTRKNFVEAPGSFVRAVNNLVKGFKDQLDAIENGLKRKIGAYQYKVEQDRRESELKAQDLALKAQAELDKRAKETGTEAVKVEMPIAPRVDPVTRTAAGSAHIRRTWDFEVVDETAVPARFKVIDPRLIREEVKAGVREIPGLKIFQKTETVIR